MRPSGGVNLDERARVFAVAAAARDAARPAADGGLGQVGHLRDDGGDRGVEEASTTTRRRRRRRRTTTGAGRAALRADDGLDREAVVAVVAVAQVERARPRASGGPARPRRVVVSAPAPPRIAALSAA